MHLLKRLLGAVFRRAPLPACSEGTFFIWEPCSSSHAEVLPGYARLLIDAGYEVSVLATPSRFDEGLFAHFQHPRLRLNHLSQAQIRRHFRKHGLGDSAGILVTTAGKLAAPGDYRAEIAYFGARRPSQRVLLVEHDVRAAVEAGTLSPEIITLRELHYGSAVTTPISPHYFGEFPRHDKGLPARFAMVGALRAKRRNSDALIDAVAQLHARGVSGFRIAVVGKGRFSRVPPRLRGYFELHGRLDFDRMYSVIAGSDFLMPLLDPENASHDRYVTTGTSGSFQLSRGFLKPCVIEAKFAGVNGLGPANAIVYRGNAGLADAMAEAIETTPEHYARLRDRLADDATALSMRSLANLKALIG